MNKAVNMEEGPMKDATRAQLWVSALIIGVIVASSPDALFARDRGVNQPGAAGNPAGDQGVNQPGATGNAPLRDRGVNQPGAAGNPGRDPGVNQPGAAGNVGGVESHRDRGVNQPGAAGNRRGPRR